jgi:hypothetical protein
VWVLVEVAHGLSRVANPPFLIRFPCPILVLSHHGAFPAVARRCQLALGLAALAPSFLSRQVIVKMAAGSAGAIEALHEFALKAGDGEAVREAIAVGRQLRVVMLEYI